MAYIDSELINPSEDKPVFSGGYVDNTQTVWLKNHFSPYLRNARLDGSSIRIRPGHILLTTLKSGDYPRGIGKYIDERNTDTLVVRHNISGTEKLYKVKQDGTLTKISTGANISSDNRMTFVNPGNVVYCMNGSDLLGKLDNTTYSTVTSNTPSSFAPSFGVIWNSCFWVSGRPDNPNIVYKSVANTFEDFNNAGSDQFEFEEAMTGLASTSQTLYYFTKNTISATSDRDVQETSGTITYITRTINVTEGAVNNASIVTQGVNVYYLTPSNKIKRLARGKNIEGFEEKNISHREYEGIDNIMNSLDPDQSDSFGYYLPETNLIKRHFKSNGSTINDVCIVYDTEYDVFFVDTGKYFYDGINFKDKNYTLSMVENKIFEDETATTDEDVEIPFEYRTKEFYLGDSTMKKVLRETRTLVDINELAGLTQEIYVDGSKVDEKTVDKDNITTTSSGIGTDDIGEFTIGTGDNTEDDYKEVVILRTKGNLNVKGKKIQFRFINNTKAGKVRLKDIDMRIEMLPPIATNLTV